MILANGVTLWRVAALPLIVYLFLEGTLLSVGLALIVLFLAVLTEVVDGLIARKQGTIRSFLDPFADKFLALGLLLFFVFLGALPPMVFLLLVIRDVLVGMVRWIASREGIDLPTRMYSIALIYSQLGIALLILLDYYFFLQIWPREALGWMLPLFLVLTLILAFFSLGYYVWVYMKGRRQPQSGKMPPEQKLLIVINRRSGGYNDIYRRHLLKRFTRRRKAKLLYLPDNKDMFAGFKQKARQIVVAGGDGSFEAALNFKPFQKKTLGFFPLGRGNAFYSYFYRGKRFEYLRSRFPFQEEELDILELEWEKGCRQTAFLSLGLDAEVIRLASRRQGGFFSYFLAGCRAVTKAEAAFDLDLRIDGQKLPWKNCVNLTLAKIPYYGFGLRSLFQVNPDDGKVYGLGVVNKHTVILNKALRLWSLVIASLGVNKPPMVEIHGQEITVKSRTPFPLQAGGEFLGFTRWIKVKVVRKQKVLVI